MFVIDVDHFLAILVDGRVRIWAAEASDLGEVDDTLEVDVMELHGTDQRRHAGRIDAF